MDDGVTGSYSGPEVPLWEVGSSIGSLLSIAGKNPREGDFALERGGLKPGVYITGITEEFAEVGFELGTNAAEGGAFYETIPFEEARLRRKSLALISANPVSG